MKRRTFIQVMAGAVACAAVPVVAQDVPAAPASLTADHIKATMDAMRDRAMTGDYYALVHPNNIPDAFDLDAGQYRHYVRTGRLQGFEIIELDPQTPRWPQGAGSAHQRPPFHARGSGPPERASYTGKYRRFMTPPEKRALRERQRRGR